MLGGLFNPGLFAQSLDSGVVASPSGDTSGTSEFAPSTTSTTPSPSGGAFSPLSAEGGLPAPGEAAPGEAAPDSAAHAGAPALFGGRIPFHVSVSLSEVYDDNIFVQPHKTSDFITRLGIQGEIRFGNRTATDSNYLDAFYQPTLLVYARNSGEDSVDQNVDVYFQHRFTRLTLSLEQSYVKSESTNSAVGNLIRTDVYTTNAKADYQYSDKLDLDAAFTQTVTDYENPGYTDTNEWVGDLYFLYKIDPKLSLGIGPRFGFLDIQGAPNQTYQQLLVRLNYDYSGKLNFKASGGGEYREYEGGAPSDTLEPVFELSGTYLPFPSTTLTLAGSRHYSPSYNFIGQDYLATSVSFAATQRFFQKFFFDLSAGYENDDYEFASGGLTGPTREDNYFYVSPGLDWRPNTWLTVSAFYRYQNDQSNFDGFTFNDNQFGLSLTASY